MVLNRLVAPSSEHAMPDWVQGTALSDILGVDLGELSDEALYRNLDASTRTASVWRRRWRNGRRACSTSMTPTISTT